jgi:hypothetical protein
MMSNEVDHRPLGFPEVPKVDLLQEALLVDEFWTTAADDDWLLSTITFCLSPRLEISMDQVRLDF